MNGWENALQKLEFEKVLQRVLRYAVSDPGREALSRIRVSSSLPEIKEELANVSETKRLLEAEEPLPLEGVHALHDALAKAAVDGMALLPRDLLHVSLTLKASRLTRAFLSKRRENYPRLYALAENLYADKVLEFNIDHAIDDAGVVRPDASKDLLAIRRAIADRYEDLRKRLAGILKDVAELGFSQDEIITTREGRMVIPVKAEHKHRVPGFIHSASSSGATVFIEPTETLELNNDIRNLQFQEQREIDRILKALTAQVGEHRTELGENLETLAQLDAIQAKAKYSIEVLGTEPSFVEAGPIRLIGARHPILVLTHGYARTVPLDLEIGGDATTLLISGPNAGGKSVAMKCVGLLVIMAQSGLHIPATEGTALRVFRSCYVDIGDEQSIENDLSTFSSHLANLKVIAEHADEGSLVLIDEIGAGTDPSEGGAIAAVLLEELTRRNAVTIATTHQGSLKLFAHEAPRVENGAMEFDQRTLTPTYRFRAGVPGSSYALEMAQRLGFSAALMERSRTRLGEQHTKLDTLIAELESATQETRKELAAVHQERQRLEGLVRQYQEKQDKLSGEIRELKKKAAEEASQIIGRANAVIENSIREIRERNADRSALSKIREEVASVRSEIVAQQASLASAPTETIDEEIRPGSYVTIAEGGDVGEIASISPDRKTAVVIFGAVKMRVPLADVHTARNRTPGRIQRQESTMEKPEVITQDLDIRGMTGDEALPLVDKFIDGAILAGLTRIDIIHGKGTGALRKKVTDFLASHPRVKSYRLGEWNEGGTGATIVDLSEN